MSDAYITQRVVEGTCIPHYFEVYMPVGVSEVQVPFNPRSDQMGRPSRMCAFLLGTGTDIDPFNTIHLTGVVVEHSYNGRTGGGSAMLGHGQSQGAAPVWFRHMAGDIGIEIRTEAGAPRVLTNDLILHFVVYEFLG